MEFLILVVLFLIALGCEKEPENANVYVAKKPVRRRTSNISRVRKQSRRSAS